MCGVCGVRGGGGVASPPRERKYIQTDLFVDFEFFVVLCWSFLEAKWVGGYDFGGGWGKKGRGETTGGRGSVRYI